MQKIVDPIGNAENPADFIMRPLRRHAKSLSDDDSR
jgi:hypothetical protein